MPNTPVIGADLSGSAPEKFAPQHSAKEVTYEGRSAEVVRLKTGAGCGEKRPVEMNGDTQKSDHNNFGFQGGDSVSPDAPEILSAHCHRVSGLTLVERIEATLTPLQVQRLDFEMREIYRTREEA